MRRQSALQPHSSRRVGWIVAVATAVFVVAMLQAGVLRDLFRIELELRVILPETGLSGLAVGADVEVLGTRAGRVTEIVLQTDGPFYAQVGLAPDMRPFVRRDSTAVIRKQFGIAGNAYLDIARGTGDPLDWDFAVIEARTERGTTDTIGSLLEEVREQVLPVVADAKRALAAIANLSETLAAPDGDLLGTLDNVDTLSGEIAAGRGTAGRLLRNDGAARDLERFTAGLNDTLGRVDGVLAELQAGIRDLAAIAGGLRDGEAGLPAALRRINANLDALQSVLTQTDAAMPAFRRTLDNTADASTDMPSLLLQTEATLAELSAVLRQLRGNWLLGGGPVDASDPPSPIHGPAQ